MALNKDKNLKLYFSISEVAQMFDVNESTLRFWEKENPETTIRHEEIVNRLKQIKEELLAMKEAFEALEASK